MGNPHVEIGIQTTLTGSGASDAAEQIEKLDDKATDASRSLDKMESEARELEQALKGMGTGTPEFQRTAEDLGKVRKEINETNALADQFAVKAGGAASSTRNWGMATLEFSRMMEDSQYGIRGMQNNLPTLLAMLGLGPGLAGVFSLAAVGGTLLYESLGKVKEEASDSEALDKLTAKFKKIADTSKQLAEERAKIGDFSLADIIDLEQQAIDRETKAFLQNIETIKRRIEAAGALDAITTQNRIAGVEGRKERGEISAEEADKQIHEIKADAARRELARAMELSKLTDQSAEAQEAAARKRLDAAEKSKAQAEAEIKEADAKAELLRREQKARQELETALVMLQVATNNLPKSLRDMSKEDLEAQKVIAERTLANGSAQDPERLQAILDRVNAALDAMAKVEEARATSPQKSLDAIAADITKLQTELARLQENLATANDKLEESRQGVIDAATDTANRKAEGEDERAAMNEQAAAEKLGEGLERAQDDWQRAGEQAGDQISKVFETWVQGLGKNAEGSKAKELIEMVREKLSDGIQEGELEAIMNTAQQISLSVNRVTSTSQQSFNLMAAAIQDQAAKMMTIKRELDRLKEDLKRTATE